jgi:hypothetical protein
VRNILAFVLLAHSAFAYGDRIFVDAAQEPLPPEIDAKVLQTLVRNAVVSLGSEVVLNGEEASATLRPNVIKFGAMYLITLEKWVNGKPTFSTKLKTQQLEELDEVVQRLVRATLTQVDAKSDARVDDVTEQESNETLRHRQVRSGSVIGVGVASLGKLHAPTLGYYFYAGRGWAIGPLVLGMRFDFCFSPELQENTAIFTDFNVNLTYYLLKTDFSPFVTGDFGLGLARDALTTTTAGGMELGATAGMALFRTYRIHVEVGLRGVALVSTSFADSPLMGSFILGASF